MKFYWPVRIEDGAFIGQKFGEHLLDYSQFGVIGHPGLDFIANKNVKIYAPHDGFIQRVNNDSSSSLGNYVIIWFEEDGFEWDLSLGHMNKTAFPTIDVGFSKKYPIKAGQLLGYVGTTGFSSGNHTHQALRQYKNQVLLNAGNGYKGCLDSLPFLADEKEKPNMSNVIFVHKAGTQEYGFYVPATSPDTIKDKALNFGLSIQKPDGTVDFGQAKEINGL